MEKGRLLWFRKLLPLNSLQRAYCFCIIIPNVSKSAFSQYLKHSQLAHKYHLYSCTAIQHIRNIIHSVLWLHSMIIWANACEPKIKTEKRAQSSPSRIVEIMYFYCQRWPKTIMCFYVESSPEGHLTLRRQQDLATGQLNCGWTAGPWTGIPIYFYLFASYWKRPFLCQP